LAVYLRLIEQRILWSSISGWRTGLGNFKSDSKVRDAVKRVKEEGEMERDWLLKDGGERIIMRT